METLLEGADLAESFHCPLTPARVVPQIQP
jgi:hypothetical protein